MSDWLNIERGLLRRALKDGVVMGRVVAGLGAYTCSEKPLQWLWDLYRDTYEQTGEVPSVPLIKLAIDTLPTKEQVPILEEFVRVLKAKPEPSPLACIKALQLRSSKNASLEAMERAADLFEKGKDVEGLQTLASGITSRAANPALKAKPLVPRKFVAMRQLPRIPTGLYRLDKIIQGIQKKELGLILGATGVGKSATGMSFAHAAVREQRRVLIIDTENGEHVTRSRYLSRFTGIPHQLIEQNVMSRETRARLEEWLDRNYDRLSKYLRVIYLGYMNSNLREVEAAINAEKAAGFDPDLTVFDSPDHLVMPGRREAARWELFAETWNQLAGIAQRVDTAMWAISQVSGDNAETKIASTGDSADSKQKPKVASIVMSINNVIDPKTKKPKPGGERVGYLAKNRVGEAKFLIPLQTDLSRMVIKSPPDAAMDHH